MKSTKLLKDSVLYLVASIVSRGIHIILLPLYANFLDLHEFGSLELILLSVSFLCLVLPLEITQAVGRFYGDSKHDLSKIIVFNTSFWFSVFVYLISFILIISFAKSISNFIGLNKDSQILIPVFALYLFTNGIFYFLQNHFRWNLQSNNFVIATVLYSTITIVAILVFVANFSLGLIGVLGGMVIGSLIGVIYCLFQISSLIQIKVSFNILKSMLKFSIPLVISSSAVLAGLFIDRIIIQSLLDIENVAIYSAAYRIASVTAVIYVGLQGALTPIIYNKHEDAETKIMVIKAFNLFLAAAGVVFITMMVFRNEMMLIATSIQYQSGADLIPLMTLTFVFSTVYIFFPGLGLALKTNVIMAINIFALLLNVILNFFLIKFFGLIGAAISTLCGQVIVALSYIYFNQVYYKLDLVYVKYMKVILFLALVTFFHLVFDSHTLYVCVYIALYGFLLQKIKLIDAKYLFSRSNSIIG
ncbi:MAG: oligosaccharide flippase family protein [Bacteroidetes bacterium]|nr:oligosaccharide flippase family protein [Bacteroidota bacterium]MDA0851615.1 oligosaccharide flippase family protein [Pseudomonadota bacterium]